VEGKELDARSDIFSLGAVLFCGGSWWMTRKPPVWLRNTC
jgi:hypothetical protein